MSDLISLVLALASMAVGAFMLGRTTAKPKPFLADYLKVLEIRDGDLLVFTTPRKLSRDEIKRFQESLAEYARYLGLDKHRALVLEDGMDVRVLRSTIGSDHAGDSENKGTDADQKHE